MINHNLDELVESSNRILLLQGPIGDFFQTLADFLISENKTVFKLNFNAGDHYFYPNGIDFVGTLDEFEPFLVDFCRQHQIDNVVCFGDNRNYHRIAKIVCSAEKIAFWAFEEGYFRPDYVTFEKNGVNAFSTIPKQAEFFLNLDNELPEPPKPKKLAKGFLPIAKLAIQYYVHAYFKRKHYPNYKHHRMLNVLYYVKLWGISGIKRLHYYLRDKQFAKKVQAGVFGEFFILPLQVHNDSQIKVHSDYRNVADFLSDVLESFALHAPQQTQLIVKHHPMDRGFIDYSEVISASEARFPNLRGRISYIHDVPMPIFLRLGKGMVTLNSTSGISALLHNMPVKTIGRANYDFEGLTDQQDLATFWQNPTPCNEKVFSAFRRYHLNKTHLNGSFYNKVILKTPYNQQK